MILDLSYIPSIYLTGLYIETYSTKAGRRKKRQWQYEEWAVTYIQPPATPSFEIVELR